jgi:hypothetical protein|tara:strand:+ start:1462 stop:1671 length:210 start_codon:yes stop_codon:yes gene_type:complete
MRKSKFAEQQIIAILAEQERGMVTKRRELANILRMELEGRWSECVRRPQAEDARDGKCVAEEVAGRKQP